MDLLTILIKMARKYDRYGRNRQYRLNPTRSRYFFPRRLPFMPDFRGITSTGTEVSAATASRWRRVVDEISDPNRPKFVRGEKRSSNPYAQAAKRNRNESALKIAEAAIVYENPLMAIPFTGIDMIRHPKEWSHRFGASVLGGVSTAAYLSSKKLI